MRFPLGAVVATPPALRFCTRHGIDIRLLLARHGAGDWGDLDLADKKANEDALRDGARIFSSYSFPQGKVWLITEADRSSTCVLLPSDY